MTLGTILQTIISLVFIYLILALLTSELQEYLATISEARAKRLKQSIRQMLGEEGLKQNGGSFQVFKVENSEKGTGSWNDKYPSINLQTYQGEETITQNSKVWLKDKKNITKIVDVDKISPPDHNNEEFIWIDKNSNTEGNHPDVIVSPDELNQGKKVTLTKFPVYQVKLELKKGERYYIDKTKKQLISPKSLKVKSLTEELYKHPNIISLNQSAFRWLSILSFFSKEMNKRKSVDTRKSFGPSYIEDSQLFAKTLIDVIRQNSQEKFSSKDKKGIIKTLQMMNFYTPAQSRLIEGVKGSSDITDLKTFTDNLQKQYEEVQKRSTGVYKRNAKGLSFAVGLLIAILVNADTFNMVSNLSKENNNFSDHLITKFKQDPTLLECANEENCLDQAKQDQLNALFDSVSTLPLGWDYDEKLNLKEQKLKVNSKRKLIKKLKGENDEISKICKPEKNEKDCIDAVINVLTNEDNTDIIPELSEDFKSSVREELTNETNSSSFQAKYQEFLKQEKRELASQIFKAQKVNDNSSTDWFDNRWKQIKKQGGWPRVAVGWWITAIAISMGASFWFDLLGKIMNVRNAGKSPVSSNETNSSDKAES